MLTVWLGIAGVLVFTIGVWIAGAWLRKHATKQNAEKSARVVHALFYVGLGVPFVVALFHPGLRQFDALLGLPPLPRGWVVTAAAAALTAAGMYLGISTNRWLLTAGHGAAAFTLTRQLVDRDIYARSRNPMSLGYYLVAPAIALFAGSTTILLATLLGVIPAHLFFLKYFEEFELRLRFGESYEEYRRRTPFLIPRRTTAVTRERVP